MNPAAEAAARAAEPALAALPIGETARITALLVAEDEGAMLRAMGIAEGQEVRVLRLAPAGDPLHIRVGAHGEFAVARPLASAIRVERAP